MKITLENQYGEVSENYILPVAGDEGAVDFSDALPAKTGVTAVVAVAAANAATQGVAYVQADVQTISTLANELKTKFNALLAALKATS